VINRVLSQMYEITRGVRQGDPLSCLIFNLAIESLASMLRCSTIRGFQIKSAVDRLVTTLFADDTTVYLSEHDQFENLQSLLNKWCRASGAKFNIKKTAILPVGTPAYCRQVLETRKLSLDQEYQIPPEIEIAKDGSTVRILGAFVGNGVNQPGVWAPVLEKISRQLSQWSKSHPTQDGCKLIVEMVVGGLTQYLMRVQGMPLKLKELLLEKLLDLCGMVNPQW
jgi:hypothetical protein